MKISVLQYRSEARVPKSQRKILKSLGLKGIGSVKELPKKDSVLGMVRLVSHLIKVLE